MATAKQRAAELAKRQAARSAAAVAEPSPTTGKAKGKAKAGSVRRRKSSKGKTSSPGKSTDATTTDADELAGLPRVDAAPEGGGPVERND